MPSTKTKRSGSVKTVTHPRYGSETDVYRSSKSDLSNREGQRGSSDKAARVQIGDKRLSEHKKSVEKDRKKVSKASANSKSVSTTTKTSK